MAAITTDVFALAPARQIKTLRGKIGADVSIPKGVKCGFVGGYVVPITEATGIKHVCVSLEAVDNSGGSDGDMTIAVEFPKLKDLILFSNDEDAPIVQASIGGAAYGVDNNTVSADSDSNTRTNIGTPWIIVDDDDVLAQRPGVYVEVI